MRLPETYNFSLAQQFAGKFTLLGGLTWTRWGRLNDIPINFSNPASQATLVSDPTLGRPGIDNQFAMRSGTRAGWSTRPPRTCCCASAAATTRRPCPARSCVPSRIPDGDRILLSAGLKYHAASFNTPILPSHVDADVELAYLHEFVHDPSIDSVDTSGHILVGKYNEQVNVASAAAIPLTGAEDLKRTANGSKARPRGYEDSK